MARILHLSDLHLHGDRDDELVADNKQNAVPASAQASAGDRLRSTLEALTRAVNEDELGLDCIVISGDIVDRNDPGGYRRLPEILAPLVPAVVPPERVVVVPGNHDVLRGAPPSSSERYEDFVQLRKHGYITPLLEGVDWPGADEAPAQPTTLTARDGSYVIVAINSADLCQTDLPIEPALDSRFSQLPNAGDPAVTELLKAWAERGEVDIAWLGQHQLRHAAEALEIASKPLRDPLRITVMHHQLMPVGAVAEIKPYESILNLGEVLEWLATQRVDIALHGHKHVSRPFALSHRGLTTVDAEQRMLVVSAPSAGHIDNQGSPIARLLTIAPTAPRTAGVTIVDLKPVGPGGAIDLHNLPTSQWYLNDDAERGRIVGTTAQEVHERIVSLPTPHNSAALPLVCVVIDGASGLSIPPLYPDLPSTESDPQAWFDRTIGWWQSPRAGRGASFNHGQRISAHGSVDPELQTGHTDQLKEAARALADDAETSRAVAILVEPSADLSAERRLFPAFVLVQFQIRAGQVHVTAYFRKQEMPHWWPINVGELAHLQGRLIEDLSARGKHYAPGSITTITAHPAFGRGTPRVQIPDLDRRADKPIRLLELVMPLYGVGDAGKARNAWVVALSDWAPSEKAPADGDPVPVFGLKELITALREARVIAGSTQDQVELEEQLTTLLLICERYLATNDDDRARARLPWLDAVPGRLNRLQNIVDRILGVIDD
ncbi:metallophosphoesterase [Microbacterium invictum]|uniref:Metallophosphoesterase n=1 Tax=Microbacterium invictum TaxID=515415 RepID=A0ABZ0VHB2_9MICO|nr:metallophosphoesterase [Microbacterium invictum]WQB71595.1 metallophosphoesterase [Microbacterium invictum]